MAWEWHCWQVVKRLVTETREAGLATARMSCAAVAVETVGRRLVAQVRQFAVDAHRIAAGQIGVAIAAEVRQLPAESRRRGQGDLVSLMAGGAARPLRRFSARRQPSGHFARPRALAVDARFQPFGDEAMALAAGRGHVGRYRGWTACRPPDRCRGRRGSWHRRRSPTAPLGTSRGRVRCDRSCSSSFSWHLPQVCT